MKGDNVFIWKGKRYLLHTIKEYSTWIDNKKFVQNNKEMTRKQLQQHYGKDYKILHIHNTFYFAVYQPC